MKGRPPALARRVLAASLPPAERGEVLAALAELFRIRTARWGRVRSNFWYWRQVFSFPAHRMRARIAQRLGAARARLARTPERPGVGEDEEANRGRAGDRWAGGPVPGAKVPDPYRPGGSGGLVGTIGALLEDLSRDARQAVRGFGAAPGFTAVAVLALGLGIGSATPTFGIINAFFLRPLPFAEPQRLRHLWQTIPRRGLRESRVSLPNFLDWKALSRSFTDMAAFNYSAEDLTDGDAPERISSGRVSANIFDVLGVEPVLGRGFRPGENEPGNTGVVVLSHGLWQGRYGGAPDILGRTLELNRQEHTIIGVMSPDFVFPLPTTQLWVPWALDPSSSPRGRGFLQVVGRLAPGVTAAQAQREMDTIARQLAEAYPETNRGVGVNVVDLRAALNFADEIFRAAGLVLAIANAFVLLIACANVSSLLLARAVSRRRELAIRSALGAARAQLARQLLVESLVLSLCGGAVGILLAYSLTAVADGAIPPDLYRVGEIGIDGAALLFTLIIAVVTALTFGLLPAVRASRAGLRGGLDEGGKGTTASGHSLRLRNQLVVAQIALALMLAAGAVLMLQSLDALRGADPGFDGERVLTVTLMLPNDAYADPVLQADFHRRVVEEVGGAPGIGAAATVSYLPLNHETYSPPFSVPGRPVDEEERQPTAIQVEITPDYFEVLGVAVRTGRSFDERDAAGSLPVAIVNRTMEDRWWPEGGAVGQTVLLYGDRQRVQVVGVVDDTRHVDLTGPEREQIYRPVAQQPGRYLRVLARTDGDPATLTATVREAIWRVDPDLPITQARTLARVVEEFLLPQRAISSMLGGLSVGAVLLACVGISGLIAFVVSQRAREMSIRMALGARRGDVLTHILGGALRLTAGGVAVGLAGAAVLARVLAGFIGLPGQQGMLGVGSLGSATLGALPLAIASMALLASYFPARRATRNDPTVSLRAE